MNTNKKQIFIVGLYSKAQFSVFSLMTSRAIYREKSSETKIAQIVQIYVKPEDDYF